MKLGRRGRVGLPTGKKGRHTFPLVLLYCMVTWLHAFPATADSLMISHLSLLVHICPTWWVEMPSCTQYVDNALSTVQSTYLPLTSYLWTFRCPLPSMTSFCGGGCSQILFMGCCRCREPYLNGSCCTLYSVLIRPYGTVHLLYSMIQYDIVSNTAMGR